MREKRKPICLVKRCLLAIAVLLAWSMTSAAIGEVGDVNGDGAVNSGDARALRDYLVGNPVGIYEANADMNEDERIDLKDIVLLERKLGTIGADDPSVSVEAFPKVTEVIYGKSEMGRDLVCTIIEPEQYRRTLLAVFAIHGFEDWYAHDGQELVDTAHQVIDHFREASALADTRLMIVAPANPDGLIDGTTNNGFGRCNAKGIDLNRDFDAAHVPMTAVRNYTPAPFSGAESRALRDLFLEYRPDILLDCHGWEDCTIGDSELAQVFYEEMGLKHRVTFSDNAHGYISYWAHKQGALALLVEFTNPSFSRSDYIGALERLTHGNYDDGTGIFEPDEAFKGFDAVKSYALSEGNVDTFLDIDGEKAGTIYGNEDLCTLQKFYKNGWVRVSYPISTGNKTAYCPLSAFIPSAQRVEMRKVFFDENQAVYRRMDLKESLGTVYPTDTSYCVAETDNALQILYPLDAGGWKLGWVPRRVVTGEKALSAANASTPKFFTTAQAASSEGNLLLPGGEVSPGDTLEIPLRLEADDAIAVRIWMIYDPTVLSLATIDNGDVLQGITLKKDRTANLYCMLWSDSLIEQENAVEGVLAHLKFQVNAETDTQETNLSLVVQAGDTLSSSLAVLRMETQTTVIHIAKQGTHALRLPEDTSVIEDEAFVDCGFDIVHLDGKSLTIIGKRAFANSKALKRAYIGPSVMNIAKDAFEGCGELAIFGEKGGLVESFALEHGYIFCEYPFD